MSRRLGLGLHTRSRVLRGLAGATVATFLFATAASAEISSISPSSGTVEPKGSVNASFTVEDSVTSCFTAAVPARFSVSFDGLGLGLLPVNCALEGARITMTVTAGAKAAPGDYQVTITETAMGGALLDTHQWPFTVPATPTTTTTSVAPTTTTSAPTTTTTEAPTTTTPGATTTSSTQGATTTSSGSSPTTTTSSGSTPTTTTSSGSSPTTTGGATDTTAGSATTTGNSTVTTGPATGSTSSVTPNTGGGNSGEPTDTLPDEPPDDNAEDNDDLEGLAAAAPEDGPPYDRYPANPGDDVAEVLSRTVFSDQLRSQISRAVPLGVADVVLSPIVIAEFLLRSLLQSAMSLLVPLLIATLVGLWMVTRMREEIDDDELALSRQPMG